MYPHRNIRADIDLTMDPYGKKCLHFNEARPFLKNFRIYSFLCRLLTRNSDRGSLLTDTIYEKWVRMTIYYGLRVKLVVSLALTNCFREFLWISYVFHYSFTFFVDQRLSQPNQSKRIHRRLKWTKQSFQLLSNVFNDFENTCFN